VAEISQEAPPADTRDPVVGALLEQIDAVILDARALVGDLAPDQFNWQPGPRRWSIGQCLQHVTLTARLYAEPLEAMIVEARGRQDRGVKPFREGWFTKWFVRSMEPPPKLRVRTFRRIEPAERLDPNQVLADFVAVHQRLADLLSGVEAGMLVRATMRSPFVPLLEFTLGQVYELSLAHARRHLWQARQVAAEPSFNA
jgi:hypothetical protein